MILNDKEILDLVENKGLIEKFKKENLQAVSYDVTISNKAIKFKDEFRYLNLVDENMQDIYKEIDISLGYDLKPNEFILTQLNEKIKLPDNTFGHIRPRTSYSRIGLIVTDQHINPSYSGVLNIGLYNLSPYVIKIVPNLAIAQIVFEKIENTPSEELLYRNKKNAKYYNEEGSQGSKLYKDFSEETINAYNKLMGLK